MAVFLLRCVQIKFLIKQWKREQAVRIDWRGNNAGVVLTGFYSPYHVLCDGFVEIQSKIRIVFLQLIRKQWQQKRGERWDNANLQRAVKFSVEAF